MILLLLVTLQVLALYTDYIVTKITCTIYRSPPQKKTKTFAIKLLHRLDRLFNDQKTVQGMEIYGN